MHMPGYRIERLIAEGGMSSVYLATQESLDRRVVIKLLKRFDRPDQAQRFLHEARVIASLQHRHVVTIYDVGTVGARPYIAMEYLEGGSLADRIEEGMPPKTALDLLQDLAACLDFVHRNKVVHRDIKPSNILFHADGTPRLTDFGVALRLDQGKDTATAGRKFGSPYYLSPEQVEDRPVDGRSDIYSLGIVFYQMLSGKRPYEAASPAETIVAHLSQPIPLLPEDLYACQGLCEQMLAKKREDRVESAHALVELVRGVRTLQPGYSAGRRVKTGHASFALPARMSAAVLAVLAISIGVLWSPGDPGSAQQLGPRLSERESVMESVTVIDANDTTGMTEGEPGAAVADDPVADAEDELVVQVELPAVQQALPAVSPVPVSTQAAGSGEVSNSDEPATVVAEVAGPQPVAQPPEAEESGISPQAEPEQPPLDLWIQAGNDALGRDWLTTPRNDNAYSHYKKVLAQAPGNREALSGLERIADRYAVLARRSLDDGNLQQARLYLDRGVGVQANHAGLRAVGTELAIAERPPEPVRVAKIEPAQPRARPVVVDVMEFEGTSVTSRGIRGSGNIAKDFGQLWRSVFD